MAWADASCHPPVTQEPIGCPTPLPFYTQEVQHLSSRAHERMELPRPHQHWAPPSTGPSPGVPLGVVPCFSGLLSYNSHHKAAHSLKRTTQCKICYHFRKKSCPQHPPSSWARHRNGITAHVASVPGVAVLPSLSWLNTVGWATWFPIDGHWGEATWRCPRADLL